MKRSTYKPIDGAVFDAQERARYDAEYERILDSFQIPLTATKIRKTLKAKMRRYDEIRKSLAQT